MSDPTSIAAMHRDTGEHDSGEVTVWEPRRRLVHTFTLAQDPIRYPRGLRGLSRTAGDNRLRRCPGYG